jgi:hypothetical protein
MVLQHLLLVCNVKADKGRAFRIRIREQLRFRDRSDGRARRAGLVVPLSEVTNEGALVLRGVDPLDPGPAARRIDRSRGVQDDDRRAINPGVVDGHDRMHQSDIAVYDREGWAFVHLGPPVRQCNRMFLV